MWSALCLVLHGLRQKLDLDFFCVVMFRAVLLTRFQLEAVNLPPDAKGGVGEGGK